MATTVADAKRMVRAAKEAGRQLGIYMDDLDDPHLADVRAAVQAGFIGRPVAFRLRYAHQGGLSLAPDSWRRSASRTGGGSFILLTIHNIGAIDWVLGTRVRRVTGFMKTLVAPMEGDDTTAAALELDNGLIGAAESSYVSDGCADIPNTVTEIRGTEGCIRHQRDERLLFMRSTAKTFRGQSVTYDKPGEAMRFVRPEGLECRPAMHEQFAASILGGKPYVWPGEMGLHDLAVCQAIAESSRTGRAVDIAKFIEDA
jgi:predicted dehydrogenase